MTVSDISVGKPSDLAEWLEMDEDVEFELEIEPVGLDIGPADL